MLCKGVVKGIRHFPTPLCQPAGHSSLSPRCQTANLRIYLTFKCPQHEVACGKPVCVSVRAYVHNLPIKLEPVSWNPALHCCYATPHTSKLNALLSPPPTPISLFPSVRFIRRKVGSSINNHDHVYREKTGQKTKEEEKAWCAEDKE